MKNNKGISLIALTITVFMIIVLAAIAIASMLASENARTNAYVEKYEQLKREIENRKTPIEDIQLAVIDAIGENGFDFDKIENNLKEKIDLFELQDLKIDKEAKEVTGKYRGESFKINEYGKVTKTSE